MEMKSFLALEGSNFLWKFNIFGNQETPFVPSPIVCPLKKGPNVVRDFWLESV